MKLSMRQQRAIQHHLNEQPNLKLELSIPSTGKITFTDRIKKEKVDVALGLMELNYSQHLKEKAKVKARMRKDLVDDGK